MPDEKNKTPNNDELRRGATAGENTQAEAGAGDQGDKARDREREGDRADVPKSSDRK